MKILVIDAGIVIKTILPNAQRTLMRQKMNDLIATQTVLYVPSLWWYETVSTLTKAVHFKEITDTDARQALDFLHQLPIQTVLTDVELTEAAMNWTFQLRRAAAYDSFYLALAQRLDTVLWTTDKRLFNAVQQDWVRYVGE